MSEKQEVQMRQKNIGQIPEPLNDDLDQLLRKLDVLMADHGYKPVPQYVAIPAILVNWLTTNLTRAEAAEKARRQFIIDEIANEFKKIMEKYSLEH